MTTHSGAIAGATAAQDAARDWQAVRADASIQYAPAEMPVPPTPPGWLKALGEFLRSIFEPVGRAIGVSWPVLQWLLIGAAVLGVVWLAWRVLWPLLARRRDAAAEAELHAPAWTPERGAALALLADADALAAAGRFDEAAHLLLLRSVGQIAAARPGWVHPATTAREIGAIAALPDAARGAFTRIAALVERSRYGLRALSADDWHNARSAYAGFALDGLRA